jgi:hypothetical protein
MNGGSACTVVRKDGCGRGVLVSILISELVMASERLLHRHVSQVFKRTIELRKGRFVGGHAVRPARLFDLRTGHSGHGP